MFNVVEPLIFPAISGFFCVIWPSVLLGFERHVLNKFFLFLFVLLFIIRAEPSLFVGK